jgi:hypothetical protein
MLWKAWATDEAHKIDISCAWEIIIRFIKELIQQRMMMMMMMMMMAIFVTVWNVRVSVTSKVQYKVPVVETYEVLYYTCTRYQVLCGQYIYRATEKALLLYSSAGWPMYYIRRLV